MMERGSYKLVKTKHFTFLNIVHSYTIALWIHIILFYNVFFFQFDSFTLCLFEISFNSLFQLVRQRG
jgi:hypothetical protein